MDEVVAAPGLGCREVRLDRFGANIRQQLAALRGCDKVAQLQYPKSVRNVVSQITSLAISYSRSEALSL